MASPSTLPASVPRWAGLMLVMLGAALGVHAQVPDSLATPAPASLVVSDTTEADTSRTPRGALRRALLVPGWGQAYNREPAKVPIVVGAMIGAGVYAVYQHDRYLLFRHAFLYQQREEAGQEPNEFERFEDAWIEAGQLSASVLRQRRTSARSSRDIAVVITGLVYALQALDAYVAAELDGFDVSEDLSLQIVPTPDGPALALRVGL
ncbi:MAG: DUF5683 domain-containing protein [Bacteroidota bacterium]